MYVCMWLYRFNTYTHTHAEDCMCLSCRVVLLTHSGVSTLQNTNLLRRLVVLFGERLQTWQVYVACNQFTRTNYIVTTSPWYNSNCLINIQRQMHGRFDHQKPRYRSKSQSSYEEAGEGQAGMWWLGPIEAAMTCRLQLLANHCRLTAVDCPRPAESPCSISRSHGHDIVCTRV